MVWGHEPSPGRRVFTFGPVWGVLGWFFVEGVFHLASYPPHPCHKKPRKKAFLLWKQRDVHLDSYFWCFRNAKANHLGCKKTTANTGINYQTQLDSRISEPSTVEIPGPTPSMPPPPGRSKNKDYGAIIMPPYDLISWGVLRWGEYIWTSMIDDFRTFPDSANHIEITKASWNEELVHCVGCFFCPPNSFQKMCSSKCSSFPQKCGVKVIETT